MADEAIETPTDPQTPPPKSIELVISELANQAIEKGADPAAVTARLGQMVQHLHANPSHRTMADEALAQGSDPNFVAGKLLELSSTPPDTVGGPAETLRSGRTAPLPATDWDKIARPPIPAVDAARTKAEPAVPGSHLPGQSGNLGNDVLESAMEMATHPVKTATNIVETPVKAGMALNEYLHGRTSGRDAATQALQTIALGASGGVEGLLEKPAAAFLGSRAGPIAAKLLAGAGTGATFTPNRPILGATLGGFAGAVGGVAGKSPEPIPESVPPTVPRGTSPEIEAAISPKAEGPLEMAPKPKGVEITGPDDGRTKTASLRAAPVTAGDDAQYLRDERAIASGVPTVEYRHSGLPVIPGTARKISDATSELLTDPNAGLLSQGGPKAVAAQSIAAANAASKLPIYAREQAEESIAHMTPVQRQMFAARIQEDNYEAEALRKRASDPEASRKALATADAIRGTLPPNVESAPWFQRAIQNVKLRVQPITESLAPEAGVSAESFRKPSLGVYVPLGSELGEAGAGIDRGASESRPASVKVAGAARRFTGGAGMTGESYPDMVARDAADKAVKATKNRVFSAVAGTGREITGATEADPETERVFAFNNKNEIVNVPEKGNEAGFRLFAVPTDVAEAVDRYRAETPPLPPGARALVKASSVATKAVLMNPAVAPLHALREAGNFGTQGTGKLSDLPMAAVPFAKSGTTYIRAAKLDVNSPEFIQAQHKAALAGALRISDPAEMKGPLGAGGRYLFGKPGKSGPLAMGLDRRLRVMATMDLMKDRARKGLPNEGPEFDGALRARLTGAGGDYTMKNRGVLAQSARTIAPFAPMHTAGFMTGARALVGKTAGVERPTVLQRAGTILRGPLGKIGAAAGATALASGHLPSRNEPGKETSLGLPLYNVPGKRLPGFYYGDREGAEKKFGAGTSEYLLRDPGESVMSRIISPMLYARRGDKIGSVEREATNFGASYLGPAAQLLLTASGFPTYKNAGDEPAGDKTASLSLDSQLRKRLTGALANATAAGSLMPLSGTRSLRQTLLPMIQEGSKSANPEASQRQARYLKFLDDARSEIRQADPTERRRKALEFGKELDGSDFSPGLKARGKQMLLLSALRPQAVSDVHAQRYAP